MADTAPKPSLPVRLRVALVYAGAAVLLIGLLGRTFALSVIHHGDYESKREHNSTLDIPIPHERGNIMSSDGEFLAKTVFSGTSIFINARAVPDAERLALAGKLSEILDTDRDDLYRKMLRRYNGKLCAGMPLAHFLDERQVRELQALIESGRAPGLQFRDRMERIYPKGESAAQLVGVYTMAGDGGAGIERTCDRYLRGTDGRHKLCTDARRRPLPGVEDEFTPSADGADVYLTLDSTIQRFAEQALEKVTADWAPEWCCAVVMESRTGRVLAMANTPCFDPSRYFEAKPEQIKNRCITDPFEPGSIFKPLILAGGIEDGLFTPDTLIPYKSVISVKGRVIRDDHPIQEKDRAPGGSHVTSAVGIVKSSNTMAVYVAQCVFAGRRYSENVFEKTFVLPYEGAGRLDARLRGFGFGAYTGLDVGGSNNGESRGSVPPRSEWERTPNAVRNVIPSIAQGYQVLVTPMQMLNCFNAIAIDGVRMKPYVIEKVVARDGTVLVEHTPEVAGNSGFSPDTAAKMRAVLTRVASDEGTGGGAKLDGYTVAGKTGTAKISAGAGGYLDKAYTCSFIGFAPVENPKLSIIVVARHPTKRPKNQYGYALPYYGGTVAAPAFAEIMGNSLAYLGVAPSKKDTATVNKEKS